MKDLFRGELVRLTSEEPDFRAKVEVNWQRDSEFHRLADGDPAELTSAKKIKEWIEKNVERDFNPSRYFFSIRALDDDKLIGFLGLWLELVHSEVWVGIGIGERDYWGKGYGTQASKMLLRFAFAELNLFRVTANVAEYNEGAIALMKKLGFTEEVRRRQSLEREARRWDLLVFGLLKDEWLKQA